MPRRRTSRVYTRTRGGVTRYYGDFRDYSDVGGRQEALIPRGATAATTDPDIADELATTRTKELERRRRNRHLLGIEEERYLAEFAAYHLGKKAETGKCTDSWLEAVQMHLESAVEYFCNGGAPIPRANGEPGGALVMAGIEDRELSTITVRDVEAYASWLANQPNGRGLNCKRCQREGVICGKGAAGDQNRNLNRTCPACDIKWRIGTLSSSSQRKYLNSLSNLYRRASGEGYLPPGYNPVAGMMDKPSAYTPGEADWLEVYDAALLLEAARLYRPLKADSIKYGYALLAAFLLTGGREAEVLGLEVKDVSIGRKTVTFRPNEWRRLKTLPSRRVIPLWPQLEEILREYLAQENAPRVGLLFPSPRTGGMINETRSWLDSVAEFAGWRKGEIRTRMFRHTYCAARLQTLDRGAPVSQYTVSRELGHGGEAMVRRVYGHLGAIRHRSEYVEYRVEQHMELLRGRLDGICS